MKERILLVDDDATLRGIVQKILADGGYRVRTADDAEDALAAVRSIPPDLLIADSRLPGLSGMKLCEILKSDARTLAIPFILLMSAGDEADKIRGLKTGADDCLIKPLSYRELLARVEAVLRRTHYGGNPNRRIEFKDLRIDLDSRQVVLKNKSLELRRKEFEILVLLMQNKNRLLSNDFISEAIWKGESIVTNNTISVHIRNLRAHLGPYRHCIKNLVGEGYRLTDD